MDVNEPVLVAVDQRAQQDASHQAEHRRVGADSQSQRSHDGRCKTFRPAQRAGRNSQFAHERYHLFHHRVNPLWQRQPALSSPVLGLYKQRLCLSGQTKGVFVFGNSICGVGNIA